jgi:hypothetical protein
MVELCSTKTELPSTIKISGFISAISKRKFSRKRKDLFQYSGAFLA